MHALAQDREEAYIRSRSCRDRARSVRVRGAEAKVLRDRQRAEHPPPLRAMRDADPHDARGRQAVDPLAGKTDRAARGRMRPEMVRSVVLLPAPFAPSSATTSPGATVRLTPIALIAPYRDRVSTRRAARLPAARASRRQAWPR